MSGFKRKTVTDRHGNKIIFSIVRGEVKLDIKENKLQSPFSKHYMHFTDGNVRGLRNWLTSVLGDK